MKKIVIYPAVLILGVTALHIMGCRGADNNIVRRAQIIVSENARLKKDLEGMKKQLDDTNRQLDVCRREKKEQAEQFRQKLDQLPSQMYKELQEQIREAGETNLSLLQMLADCLNQLQEGGEPNDLPAEAGPNP